MSTIVDMAIGSVLGNDCKECLQVVHVLGEHDIMFKQDPAAQEQAQQAPAGQFDLSLASDL